MRRREMRLCNVIFPIWLLWFFPPAWVAILPANFAIDFLALALTLRRLQVENRRKLAGELVWKVWIFGFLADLVGTAALLPSQMAAWGEEFIPVQQAIAYDPLGSGWAFLWVGAAVLLAAVCIYWFDRRLALKNAPLTETQKHTLSLSMAVFTAPYLFFLPMKWFW